MDVISARQFTRAQIEELFSSADARGESLRQLTGKTLAMLFYAPSTRTRASFENAMRQLGGNVVEATAGAFPEAVTTINADAILVRHPEIGAAQIAADATRVPVINAGDGAGENPTQALALLHALRTKKKKLDGIRIALVGDLKNDRAAHSLAYLLTQFHSDVSLVAPAAMSMPYDVSDVMRHAGLNVEETNDLPRVLPTADAVILARVDQKNFSDAKQFEKMKNFYRLEEVVAQMRAGTWLGGSWNGGDSILADAYQQTDASGLFVRMALLAMILE